MTENRFQYPVRQALLRVQHLLMTVVNYTYSIALNESWKNSTVKFRQLDNGDMPPVIWPNLWPHSTSNTLYKWGGAKSFGQELGDEGEKTIWSLQADGNGGGEWTKTNPLQSKDWQDTRQGGFGAAATCDNEFGVSLGGYAFKSTDPDLSDVDEPIPVPGILSFNMETREWANSSTKELSPPLGTWQEGTAVCTTDFGDNPLVVALGGEHTAVGTKDRLGLMKLDTIHLFDPIKKCWLLQTATGDIPDDRNDFCSVGVRSPNGTYEIYIYGGNSPNREFLDDVFCLDITRRQMLVLGGILEVDKWQVEDPWHQGLGILDLPTLSWKDSYDPDLGEYSTPPEVQDWYHEGGMTGVKWDSDEVEKIFNRTIGESNKTPESQTTKIGPIVGGILAGVFFLSGILGAALYWHLRRRRKLQQELAGSIEAYAKPELDASSTSRVQVERQELPSSTERSPEPYVKPELDAYTVAPPRVETDMSSPKEQIAELHTASYARSDGADDDKPRIEDV
ncbi:hypothetical protein NM208_g3099 [Fusarium decemcellulare]|uniref:Uncharacterized protein n=1 Tax=Fusarium decemcellulare TaxID=57161 RepID=A0ACC1SQ70_9HYPO|nr:hypothetical protein NM208_g3099 [Fusarium decemcellulare]